MKKIILIFLFSGLGITYGQMEFGGGLASVAVSDGDEAVSGTAGQLSFDYDFLSDSKLRAAVGADIIIGNSFAAAPGVKLGFDFVNLKINVDTAGVLWYGLGSRIGIGDVHGITIGLQVATEEDLGLGWFFVGYSFRL